MQKLLVVAAIFLSALVALVYAGVASAIPVVTVADVASPEHAGNEVEVKDSKLLAVESIAPLRFTVVPRQGSATPIQVESPRTVPENFKLGIDVGLRGAYNKEKKVFEAYRVTTKCPSKYEASKDGSAPGGGAYSQPAEAPVEAKI